MISRKALAGMMSEDQKKRNAHNLNTVVSNIQQRGAALREAAGGCGQAGQPSCSQPKPKKK